MLLTLMMNLGMFGPPTPTPSGTPSSPIISIEEGGGWHKGDKKENRIKKQNQDAVIIAVSEWLINNN